MNIRKEADKALDRYKRGRWNGWVENRGHMQEMAQAATDTFGPFPAPVETRQQRRWRERHG